MNLVRRKNYPVFGDMMHSLFNDDFFHPINSPMEQDFSSPSVNIKEDEKGFTIEAVLAGMSKKDIQIDIKENMLMISAEKEEKKEESEDNFTMKEFSLKKYRRNFRLPKNVDQKGIKADYTDGILSVTIPKMEHKEIEGKTIKIS